jgi:tRNA-specific 2-thiouridylase
LQVADKADSQEICFVPDGDYASFVARQQPAVAHAGTIVDGQGHAIGTHGGVHRFTVGQRKGLGVSAPAPLYVLKIEAESGQVTVGPREALERTTLNASTVNWIAIDPPGEWRPVSAQIRHRHAAAPGLVRATPGDGAEFLFDQPQLAVAPGQAVVFYDGDLVIGGGWID